MVCKWENFLFCVFFFLFKNLNVCIIRFERELSI